MERKESSFEPPPDLVELWNSLDALDKKRYGLGGCQPHAKQLTLFPAGRAPESQLEEPPELPPFQAPDDYQGWLALTESWAEEDRPKIVVTLERPLRGTRRRKPTGRPPGPRHAEVRFFDKPKEE